MKILQLQILKKSLIFYITGEIKELRIVVKGHANLHPALNSVTADILNALTVAYSGSTTRDEDGDEIVGVNVKGRFDEDSESVDVSEI